MIFPIQIAISGLDTPIPFFSSVDPDFLLGSQLSDKANAHIVDDVSDIFRDNIPANLHV